MPSVTPHAIGSSKRCGARTRSGGTCQQWAMANGRCRMHGGKSLAGTASPSFKTGRYSRHIPARLAERYEAALADTDLLALRDEIGLLDARISALLDTCRDGEDDPAQWERIQAAMEQRRKLVDSERRRLVDMQQMISSEQAMALIAAISEAVRRHVDDRAILAAISADVARIISRAGRDDDRRRD